jgi:hypothetical protein
MRNIAVLFCLCESVCVQHAGALLFRIDAGQEPFTRPNTSVTTRIASLVRTQYRPPVRDGFLSVKTTRNGPVSDQLSDYAAEPPCPKSRSMTVAPVWITRRDMIARHG